MTGLKRLEISGYKSIKKLSLELHPLNVLIGANGAGKSNFVSFFKFLNEMVGERFQEFIGTSGGAHSLLHYGPKVTPQMEAALDFASPDADNTYRIRLTHAAVDTLIFTQERLEFHRPTDPEPRVEQLGPGQRETALREQAESNQTARVFRHLIANCRVFQFHDTSSTAPIRQSCYVESNRFLMPDAGNLAAVLYRLCRQDQVVYRRIVATIRQVAPFLDDFDLAPSELNPHNIVLNWRDRESDMLFGPHQLSDGTLRAMALFTLLLLPQEELPPVVVIDEPELGLHPSAIVLLAALLKQASVHCQVIVATQSVPLIDEFEPEDVVVVEREGRESVFRRLDSERLADWLKEYSLGELWQKNVLGGGPF